MDIHLCQWALARGYKPGDAIYDDQDAIVEAMAEIAKHRDALRAIIDRADNGTLGSSKVQDMRKLAEEALNDKGILLTGAPINSESVLDKVATDGGRVRVKEGVGSLKSPQSD